MKIQTAIALLTFKEIIRQPVFIVVIFGSIALQFIASCFALFAFGEESRMIENMGVATITLSGLIIAVFCTSHSFSSEIKKSAVATILCKAVSKPSFIIGKFIGIVSSIILVYLILLMIYGIILSFYNVDKELHNYWYTFFTRYASVYDLQFTLNICFSVMQVMILASISFFLSLNISSAPNISICFSLYLLGNISTYFKEIFKFAEPPILTWLPKLLFTVIPDLQILGLYSVKLADFTSFDLLSYIVYIVLYTLCFCSVMIMLSILSFNRKDMF